jgi:hypothetical protein
MGRTGRDRAPAAKGELIASAPRVDAGEIDRDREEQKSRPPVDGIEDQGLVVADDVGDQPDDEPDQRHGATLSPSLAKPAAMLVVVEDDDVLAALQHHVEVTPVDRILRPPAVDDAPFLANQLDRQAIDETRRPVCSWLDEGGARLI